MNTILMRNFMSCKMKFVKLTKALSLLEKKINFYKTFFDINFCTTLLYYENINFHSLASVYIFLIYTFDIRNENITKKSK